MRLEPGALPPRGPVNGAPAPERAAAHPAAAWHPSPNFGPRCGGASVALVVLHYTAMDSAGAALARLCDPAAAVSAHYLVGRCGTLWQLVAEEARAWHAGAGAWAGAGDVNSRSLGIEIDNDGRAPFAAAAMDRLEPLLADLMARHALPPEAVIGHGEMAPGRKADPGPRFDWRRLARQGLALWPETPPVTAGSPDAAAFAAALDIIGYPDAGPAERLAAFRDRYRPWASGPLSAEDCALARARAEPGAVDAAGARA